MLVSVRAAVVSSARRGHVLSDRTGAANTWNQVAWSSNGLIQSSQPVFKIDRSKFPKVNERDLEEKFISGSGPGGQCVNKAINCCQIKHVPTGIVVKVHQSRSLDRNREIARELLAHRLDNLYNGEDSIESQQKRVAKQKIAVRESQMEKKRAMKEEFRKTLANQAEEKKSKC